LLGAIVVSGCPSDVAEKHIDDDGSEDLTVVVEADKSRILAEEATLNRKRASVEAERERLERERERITQQLSSLSKKDRKARYKLEAEQKRLASDQKQLRDQERGFLAERAKLDKEKTELLERIARVAGSRRDGLTLEQREARVQEREKNLRQFEKQLDEQRKELSNLRKDLQAAVEELRAAISTMGGPSRTVVVNASSGGPTASRAQVIRLQSQIKTKMRAKGILEADLPPAAHDYQEAATRSIAGKDWSSAYESLTQVATIVSNIKIDHAFVQAKFRRINKSYEGKMKTLAEKNKKAVLALLDDVSDSFSDGRYDRANRKINQIHSLLGGN
jgi:hypothetical protein